MSYVFSKCKLGAAPGGLKQEEVFKGELGCLRYFETIILGYKDP